MANHIALLRGVNLAGHKMIAMADLRRLCSTLGFDDPRTILQSGNLVFRGRKAGAGAARTREAIERLLEQETEKRLKVKTTFFVRTAAEWDAIVSRNPLTKEAGRDPGRMLVYCLKDTPARGAADALRAAIAGPEVAHVIGREAYLYYPDGVGRSKVTTAIIDRALGTLVTGRNWNTVMKLAALAAT